MHPDQEALKELVLDCGFDDCKFYNLLNGIVAIHVGYKE
jgi:demethylmenaquinone methyltransferase/2-methoxy-6-polyprenyl-1,4-benzoquinol methylase